MGEGNLTQLKTMDYTEYKIEQITMLLWAMLLSNIAMGIIFFMGLNL
jgi:hypothetical protein